MKCPYNEFKDCIMEKCPSCNYEENEEKVIDGRYPNYMSVSDAIKRGMAFENTRITRKFVSCKLVDSNVQPVPPKKEIITNTKNTNIIINKSIF